MWFVNRNGEDVDIGATGGRILYDFSVSSRFPKSTPAVLVSLVVVVTSFGRSLVGRLDVCEQPKVFNGRCPLPLALFLPVLSMLLINTSFSHSVRIILPFYF